MKADHECFIPRLDLPWPIQSVRRFWRCPDCGKCWSIHYHRMSYAARSLPAPFPNIKLWRWRRDAKRKIEAKNYKKGKP